MEKILFKEYKTKSGHTLGHVILNRPKVLNVLDGEMAVAFKSRLQKWDEDPKLLAFFFEGAGDKGFCAGGDVKNLYYQIEEGEIKKAKTFFNQEYSLDLAIHEFSKPIVAWGNGILMGGGIGLFIGASHRLVTADTIMAMPEVRIGFFPDVGASYFLNRTPHNLGILLGMTGGTFSGADGIYLGFADFMASKNDKDSLLQSLRDFNWSGENSFSEVDKLVSSFVKKNKDQDSSIFNDSSILKPLCQKDSFEEFILSLDKETNSSWLEQIKKVFSSGSPLAAKIIWEQFKKTKTLSLKEVFEFEKNLACRFVDHGEFKEGVRALLVDKDQKPQWSYRSPLEVPCDVVESFFL